MNFVLVDDWTSLPGVEAEVRLDGISICSGKVDAVTPDGEILWLAPAAGTRKLYEKAEHFQAWARTDKVGVRYWIAKGTNSPGPDSEAGPESGGTLA